MNVEMFQVAFNGIESPPPAMMNRRQRGEKEGAGKKVACPTKSGYLPLCSSGTARGA